jgi:hypothetical protein
LDSKPPLEGEWSKKTLASQEVVGRIVKSSPQQVDSTISISPGRGHKLAEQFFTTDISNDKAASNSQNTVIVVVDIHRECTVADSKPPKSRKLHRAILAASEKQQIPVLHESIVGDGGDFEGVSVTCLQHLLYQNRLFSTLSKSLSGNKRKSSLQ